MCEGRKTKSSMEHHLPQPFLKVPVGRDNKRHHVTRSLGVFRRQTWRSVLAG